MPGRLAYAGGLLVLVLAGYGLSGCAGGGVSVVTPNHHRHTEGKLHLDTDVYGVQHERQTAATVDHSS